MTTTNAPRSIEERNRNNAQHSTGPKTEEGKAKSAQNSRQHGLSASTLWVPANVMPQFISLRTALHNEIRPIGELQLQFFEQLLHAAWQQNIARERLTKAQTEGDERRESTMHRYVRQYERSYASALKEIRNLQADMAVRAAQQNGPFGLLPESYNATAIVREVHQIVRLTERTQRQQLHRDILTHIGGRFLRLCYPNLATEAPAPPIGDASPAAA
jgi:hypothetical protein